MGNPITHAARAGDIAAFRRLTVGLASDPVIAAIRNAPDAAEVTSFGCSLSSVQPVA